MFSPEPRQLPENSFGFPPLTNVFFSALAVEFSQSLCWTDCTPSISIAQETPVISSTVSKVVGYADPSIIIMF